MLELHHAVPALGAALVTVNVRLSATEMAEILDHSGASMLVATHEFADRARDLAKQLNLPCFIAGGSGDSYEAWIEGADPAGVSPGPVDERQILAINYTSGTTGRPKGVMYHHRGAYLQATAMAYHARLGPGAKYLWTLPMFHCNGWCFTWAVTAAGGTHVCLRAVDTGEVWRLLRDRGDHPFQRRADRADHDRGRSRGRGPGQHGPRGHGRRAAVGDAAGPDGRRWASR